MKKEFEFKAYVKLSVVDGLEVRTFIPSNSSKTLLRSMLFDYDDGDAISVTVRPWSEHDTQAINRFFHKVLRYYYKTGMHSYSTFNDLKQGMMKEYGRGIETYLYMEDGAYKQVKTLKEVPPDTQYFGWVGSWATYSKHEMYETLQGMITEMKEVGVSGKEFDQLIGEAEE